MYVLVAKHTPANQFVAFYDRLTHSWWQLGLMLIVMVVLGAILFGNVIKPAAVLAVIGGGWMTWKLFNIITQTNTPLVRGEGSILRPFQLFGQPGLSPLFALLGVAVALLTYFTSKKTQQNENVAGWLRITASLAAYVGTTLIFILVIHPVLTAA